MNLDEIRSRINTIDRELVSLLEERLRVVEDVAKYKAESGKAIRDQKREDQVVKRVMSHLSNPKYEPYMERIFRQLMMVSSRMQYDMIGERHVRKANKAPDKKEVKVGYLGTAGSFSEQAVVNHYGEYVEATGYPTFDAVMDALTEGQIQRAVLPIENSSTGSVNRVVDLIRDRQVYMVGETMVMVRHFLLGVKGTRLEGIKTVYSHPQPLEQCGRFLREKAWETIPTRSTTAAAQKVADIQDTKVAAIGSKRTAKLLDLDILAKDIQDNHQNYTRFAILSTEPTVPENADKVSLVFTVSHQPGALYHALRAFADRNINLIKLESRPVWSQPWHYFFHLDLSGRLDDERIADAIEEVSSLCETVKVLGNYKACNIEVPEA